jgi:hypothetical protein
MCGGTVAANLLVVFAAAALGAVVAPSAGALTGAVFALVSGVLSLPARLHASTASSWQALGWPAAVTIAATAALLALAPSPWPMLLALAPGILCFSLLLEGAARVLARAGMAAAVAAAAVAGGFLLACGTPVWLAPALADTSAGAVVALSPLSHLAVPLELDYLRGAWFYQHSPLGGLRFDYPRSAHTLALGAVAAGVLLLHEWLRGARARSPRKATPTRPNRR